MGTVLRPNLVADPSLNQYPVSTLAGSRSSDNPHLLEAEGSGHLSGTGHQKRTFSFVATSRNDDHGGDALRRTQSFVNGLALQCERHGLRGELVLVDWNPPASRPPLADVLSWPEGTPWFTAKVVTVPHEVHLRLPNARALTIFQMIAKNVGLRRASGDFLIATNIDIIFSDEIMEWMQAADLRDGVVYRSDRWDIPNDIQLEPDFDALLARARREAIRHNRLDGTSDIVDGVLREPQLKRVDHLLISPIRNSLQAIRYALDQGEDVRASVDHLLQDTLPNMRRFYLTPPTHLNGCGDFTMMSKAGWSDLRGYPEWPVFSWNIDSVTLIHAVCSGYEHIETPRAAVHFHIEHSYGSGYTPQGWDSLWSRMQQRDVTVINWEDFRSITLDMEEDFQAKKRIELNAADWGMAGLDLPIQETSQLGVRHAVSSQFVGTKLIETFDTTDLESRMLSTFDADLAKCETLGFRWLEGDVATALRFPASQHGYGVVWSTKSAWPRGQHVWLRLMCEVRNGQVSLSLLTQDESHCVHEVPSLKAGSGRREVIARVGPFSFDPKVVLRNHGAEASEVEISSLEIFWKPEADIHELDWLQHLLRSPWAATRDKPPALCSKDFKAPLQDYAVLVASSAEPQSSIHVRKDLVRRELNIRLHMTSSEAPFRDAATGALSFLPSPQPWAFIASRDLLPSEMFEGPHWVVLEFASLHGSFGVGLLDREGQWISRLELPRTSRPIEVWLRISELSSLKGFAIQNWQAGNEEAAMLHTAWIAREVGEADKHSCEYCTDSLGWADVSSALQSKDGVTPRDGGFLLMAGEPQGHALYGPYCLIDGGKYEIALAMQADVVPDEPFAAIEIAIASGPILLQRELLGRDIEEGRAVFRFEAPAADRLGQLELRLSHFGKMDIMVSSVRLRTLAHDAGTPA